MMKVSLKDKRQGDGHSKGVSEGLLGSCGLRSGGGYLAVVVTMPKIFRKRKKISIVGPV
jgi:hypothetical protein